MMNTLLFFDDWYLKNRFNVVRQQGIPQWDQQATFEDACIEGLGNFPTVFRQDTDTWRAMYWAYTAGVRLLTAESKDGRAWRRSDVSGLGQPTNRKHRHELFRPETDHFIDAGVVFHDHQEDDPERRFKFVFMEYEPGWSKVTGGLATSPDGLRWAREPANWHAKQPDPPFCVFFRKEDRSYVITCRPAFNDRRIAFVETTDWKSFSEPQLIMHPQPNEPPLVQFFGMPVFPYEDYYIGLLWFLHCDPYEVKETKIEGGIDCRLAYSYDGRMFNRTFDRPFIPRNPRGQHGSGCIYPSSMLIDDENVIRIYSGSSYGEHFRERTTTAEAALLLYTLRMDGFVYLESYSHRGWVTTRPFRLHDDKLRLNLRAPHGQVRVQISDSRGTVIQGFAFDDCVPFRGDALFHIAQWKDKHLGELIGQWIRIEFEMTHAELYAVRADLEPFNCSEYVKDNPEGIARWERLRMEQSDSAASG